MEMVCIDAALTITHQMEKVDNVKPKYSTLKSRSGKE